MSRLIIGAAAFLACCAHAPEAAPAPKQRQPTAEEKAWFDGLKNAIGPEWIARTEKAVEAHDPEGCRDFAVERHLVVEFVVNADGVFTRARVRESSGLPYIDQLGPATFTAVHRVSPPPRSLVGKKLPFAFNVNARPNPYSCAR
ncbi:MAG: energy transducer TonB [Myxococcales bacterium]|nr:energy transducer TonB [Myxococcales bacterium]